MIIRIKNLIVNPVSLPGPLPRLECNDDITTDITPEDYDLIKDELGILVTQNKIQVFMEVGGSFLGNFIFDDENSTISHKGVIIASPGVTTDEKVKASPADTVPGDLAGKIAAGFGILLNIIDPGANEKLELTVDLESLMPNHKILLDEVGGGITYIGEASPGSITSDAVWRIFRLDESASGSEELKKEYADGVSTFTKIWDNRATYTYSS